MRRFWLGMVLGGSAALGWTGCNKNVDPDAELKLTTPGQASQPESPAASAHAPAGAALEGVVRVSPALGGRGGSQPVMFLIARKPEGGPPLAVQKVVAPTFPYRFRMTGADVMVEGFELSGEVLVAARLDADGSAGPVEPGDWIGKTTAPVLVGGPPFELVIDEAVGGARAAAPRIELPPAPPGDTMAAPQASLEGTVQLDPSLASGASGHTALFLIVRSSQGGPPLAVKRIVFPAFPLRLRLTQEDVMLQGRELTGKVSVTARLDLDGSAGPAAPGDLEGSTPEPVSVGGPPFTLVIDRRVP
jgi:hypothetical protein